MSTLKVSRPSLPGQQFYEGSVFPLVITCDSPDATLEDVKAWIQENRDTLTEEASVNGTILFRDFPVPSVEAFDEFIQAFGYRNFKYEDSLSNAVRVVKTERVFTANEAPPNVTIFFHHEMAQTPVYPGKLMFYCEVAPESGGATPLCRSDVLYERMQRELPEFCRACEEKGLKYTNVMPAANDPTSGMGRSWQSTLATETKEGAETRLAKLGYSWEWLDDGCLKATTPVLPAVRELPDGRKVFFNQLIAAYKGWKDTRNDPSKAITHGDGTILDRDAVLRAADIAEELAFDVPWQVGDVALVDNYVAMHGRRTFTGTRRVLASLVAADEFAE
ncbi:MAG: TauD/TfdA family dioxygenase [Planctomycetaceae bacterium]|nr:TauD/TfdA family dioxygenase [Planctomycetaceae bacterium]MCB1078998.1 TauD/TfdA family dioxygenase [Verrucomicrobiae bacterium]